MHHHYHYHLRHHITLDSPNHHSDTDNNSNNNMPTDSANSNNKATGNKTAPTPGKKDECVGSLLVHPTDVQELSSVGQKDECVGTLLVHQTDVQELSSVGSPKIVRRMTERVAKAIEHFPEQQIDPDDDILAWQCDI